MTLNRSFLLRSRLLKTAVREEKEVTEAAARVRAVAEAIVIETAEDTATSPTTIAMIELVVVIMAAAAAVVVVAVAAVALEERAAVEAKVEVESFRPRASSSSERRTVTTATDARNAAAAIVATTVSAQASILFLRSSMSLARQVVA